MKVRITLTKEEILVAIRALLVERGVPIIASEGPMVTLQVWTPQGKANEWATVGESKVEARVICEFEAESYSSGGGK